MHDIAEISKTKCSDNLSEEESESALFELVEFIRMAVLLIYTQCEINHGKRSQGKGTTFH